MSFDLPASPRLLVEAHLTPAQGRRFQPTGFPDLGFAEYKLPDGTSDVLVESPQSVANRLEAACLDAATGALHPALAGLPYIEARDASGAVVTNSLLEAHRVNSPYLIDPPDSPIRAALADAFGSTERVDDHALATLLFRFDPNSLVHGVFIARKEYAGGRLRLPRALSGFIEAHDVRAAESGGVKNDIVNPGGDAARGYGNVPFARTEYTASRIVAYFNLDLGQLRAYRLGADAERLLFALSVFKIHRFLGSGLRLRTACDLDVTEVRVTRPDRYALPTLDACERALPELIGGRGGGFADPAITVVKADTAAGERKGKKGKGQ
jgi:CRISPR-associated protein Csb1